MQATELPGSSGIYSAEYSFPVYGVYNLALQTSISNEEVWAFFRQTIGEPQSLYAVVGRLSLSLAIAVSIILGVVSLFSLSGRTKLLLFMIILFLSMSFTLTVGTGTTHSTVVVYVLDENGNPISNALVTISEIQDCSAVTDGGYCVFRDVPSGTFSVSASAEGYFSSEKEERITAGQILYVFIFLSRNL